MNKALCKQLIRKQFASCEANCFEKLEEYVNLLLKWNQHINLVGRSTIDSCWQRHILDSIQLLHYLPKEPCTILDLGSGAGLPGLVLGITTNHQLILVESDQKKSTFLQTAAFLCNIKPTIMCERINKLPDLEVDFIVSRALAPLKELFNYSFSLQKQKSVLLLHKGRGVYDEIEEASQSWQFSYNLFESLAEKDSYIIEIKQLTKSKP